MKKSKDGITEITLNKFLFKSIIIIIISVYMLYKLVSFIADSYASYVFSEVAKEYSADYFFNDDYLKKSNIISNIHKIGGIVLVLDDDGAVTYSSIEIGIKKVKLEDIVALQNSDYEINKIKYHASIKKLEDGDGYGLILIPSEKVKNTVNIKSNAKENIKFIIRFLIIRTVLLIVGIIILVFIFSKTLKQKFVKPLSNLKMGFNKLKKEDYDVSFEKENILEFNDINKSFCELSNELKTLNDNKNEYKRKRDRLFSDISHDLKTPVTVIKGYLEAILQNKISDDEINKYIVLIKNNADSLEKLTVELSDIVNYDRDNYSMNLEKVDIFEYVRQIIIDFLPVFEQNGVEVICNIDDKKYYYDIDTKLFSRVIQNLIKNIVDHNPRNITAFFDIVLKEDVMNIIVADSGVSIDEKLGEDIFDEFVTYDKSRNSFKENNGLGLAIVKKIVQLHKGRVYLVNDYERYSKAFIIELPLP